MMTQRNPHRQQIIRFALVLSLGVFLSACAAPPPPHLQRRESSIPWNRPASWEGAGAMGGAMPTGIGN